MVAQKKTITTQASHEPTATALTRGDLGIDIVEREIASAGISINIRQLRQNWRQGTVACKGRSDISFSNKKPWKQKGTGRARAGSARSPLWRGGGVTFGPQPRVRTLKTSKNLRQGIFNTLICDYLDKGNIYLLPWEFNGNVPKTSYAYNLLKQANLTKSKIVLFVGIDDVLVYSSFVNIPNVQVLTFDGVNSFDLMNGKHWIVLQKDLPAFKEMVSQWL